MRVGLVRHFPVEEPMPSGRLTDAQLQEWRVRYDAAPARPTDATIDQNGWVRCYSSDMSRTYATARALYDGEIIQTPLLREPDVGSFGTGDLSLPAGLWRWILRFAWLTGHRSQRVSRDDFTRRVKSVADIVESGEEDILIFSHAGMMAYLSREFMRRGFAGPRLRIAEHARLYVYERR